MPWWKFVRLPAWSALVILAAGCIGAPGEQVREDDPLESAEPPMVMAEEQEKKEEKAPPVRFLAWGDSGHGSSGQRRVGETARAVCEREGCDFVLQLGDNIYDVGVESVHDPQFRMKFELPYQNLSLPFYLVLGNHDVAKPLPDSSGDNGVFQLAYDDDRGGPSTKWNMPDRNYTFARGDAEFFALDLTAFMRRSNLTEEERAEAARLAERIDGSNATWRFAFSHFPYVSNGDHGNAGEYDGKPGQGAALKEFLEAGVCDRADVYFAAHDHNLEWLQPVPECGATEFVVSGAASEPDPIPRSDEATYFSQGETLGFFWFEVDGPRLTGRAYDVEGNVLFERVVEK